MTEAPLTLLEAAMKRRMDALPRRLRPFTSVERKLPRACIVSGQRGVGKTTFLLHHAKGRNILYLSADNPLLAGSSLYETAQAVFMNGYAGIIVDEAHFAREWSLHLKALQDDFPKHTIWVSDSSSLVLRSGTGDLSRRFVPIHMPILSFREYLTLETGNEPARINPFEADFPLRGTPEILTLFRAYREHGTRPFYTEGDFVERMRGVLDKTLYSDIPFFIPRVTEGNLRLMNAIVGSLATSSIPRIKVRTLCSDWNVGAQKLYQLLFVMESVGLLRIIRRPNDTKASTVGDKMFFGDPVFYEVLQGNIGNQREAFVAAMLAEAGFRVESYPDETKGDFVVSSAESSFTIEIGGRSKRAKQADFVIRDDIDAPVGRALPMWSLGFLY